MPSCNVIISEQTRNPDASKMPLYGLGFIKNSAISARRESLMNPVNIESSVGLDRLAAW
jgi:hypothetical protein